MAGGLVGLIVLVIVVGVILLIAKLIIDKIPMDETFRQIAWLLVILLAVVVVITKALPLIGVSL
jgi:hypothetical protein